MMFDKFYFIYLKLIFLYFHIVIKNKKYIILIYFKITNIFKNIYYYTSKYSLLT